MPLPTLWLFAHSLHGSTALHYFFFFVVTSILPAFIHFSQGDSNAYVVEHREDEMK